MYLIELLRDDRRTEHMQDLMQQHMIILEMRSIVHNQLIFSLCIMSCDDVLCHVMMSCDDVM